MTPAKRSTPAKKRTARADPGPASISLILIDDNRLLREGIAALIHTQPGFKVLAAFADVEEALKKVREAEPDIVLLDFGLEDHDSVSLTATVHEEVPAARVIVMGLLPMTGWLHWVPVIGALGSGAGAELRAPMAITVIAGLTSATLLTLIVIPSIYALLARRSVRAAAMAARTMS